jgi:hypothetical protein
MRADNRGDQSAVPSMSRSGTGYYIKLHERVLQPSNDGSEALPVSATGPSSKFQALSFANKKSPRRLLRTLQLNLRLEVLVPPTIGS